MKNINVRSFVTFKAGFSGDFVFDLNLELQNQLTVNLILLMGIPTFSISNQKSVKAYVQNYLETQYQGDLYGLKDG